MAFLHSTEDDPEDEAGHSRGERHNLLVGEAEKVDGVAVVAEHFDPEPANAVEDEVVTGGRAVEGTAVFT